MAKCNTNPQPPLLDPEGDGFTTWKGDIDLWNTVTKFPEHQRAIFIYLSLTGIAKLAAEQIPHEKLQDDQGVQFLLKTLEDHFLPSKPMRLFKLYNKLRYVIRKPGVSIHDYLSAFEHAKFLLEKEGVKKDDTILALDLLSQCHLPIDKTQLVMSSISAVTYENVKEKLNSVFLWSMNYTINLTLQSVTQLQTQMIS